MIGAAAALAFALAAGRASASEPVDESYHKVFVGGKEAGTMVLHVLRQPRGTETMFLSRRMTELFLAESGRRVRVISMVECFESAEGRIEAFIYHRTLDYGSQAPVESYGVTGRLSGERMEFTVTLGKEMKRGSADVKGELLGQWAVERKIREAVAKNAPFEAQTIVPETCRIAVFRFKPAGEGIPPIPADGKNQKCSRIEVESEALEGSYFELRDQAGMLAYSELSPKAGGAGSVVATARATREEMDARSAKQFSIPPIAPKPFAPGRKIDFTRPLKLRISGPDLAWIDASGFGQSVVSTGEGRIVIRVDRSSPPPEGSRPFAPPVEMIDYLAEKDPVDGFQKLGMEAEEMLRGDRRAWKSASLIAEHVGLKYGRDPWSGMLNPASAYIRARSLTPWGKAVLLVAWCRAASVPSRMVGGLRISDGQIAPDIWAEVYTGEWISLDSPPASSDRVRLCEIRLGGLQASDLKRFLETASMLTVEPEE